MPRITDATATIRNRKNNTWAIDEAPAAMPPKPKIAATIATTKKTNAQYNMGTSELCITDDALLVQAPQRGALYVERGNPDARSGRCDRSSS
jgi:hypothetical protein